MEVKDLPRYRFPDPDSGKEVVRVGNTAGIRPVVLLHELGGLTRETVDYADSLVLAGCVVHMPLVFGSVGEKSTVKASFQLCWSRQLTMLLSNRRSKLADWLADFCDHLHEETGSRVVVIGMCATGGVVFSVLMRESVGGGVAAQPSLPLRLPWSGPKLAALGATVDEVMASADSGKPLAAIRYNKDLVCPAGRLLQISELFGDASIMEVEGWKHSTLVYDRSEAARQRVVQLLDEVFGTGA